MGAGRRLLGGTASLAVNMLLMTLLVEAAPRRCQMNCLHATYLSLNNGIGYPPYTAVEMYSRSSSNWPQNPAGWMPFIDLLDATGSSSRVTFDKTPLCNVKARDPTLRLIDAPLPFGLPVVVKSLSSQKDTRVVLCVQVDPNGYVRRAYLPRSTGNTFRDERLLHLVAMKWRFGRSQAATPYWVRIRLDKTDVNIRLFDDPGAPFLR